MPREADFGLRPKALQAAPAWIRECRSAARLACSRLLPATLVQQPFVQEVLDPHALCQSLKPPLIQDGELQIQRRPSPAAHSPGACGVVEAQIAQVPKLAGTFVDQARRHREEAKHYCGRQSGCVGMTQVMVSPKLFVTWACSRTQDRLTADLCLTQ
jgi:hypothetical protein